jgi:FtsP/CotA-like multicopper oxidase with cupredoxin domain
LTHPFHLHGHQFAIVDLGKFNETFTEKYLKKNYQKIPIKFHSPVYKDTILVPLNGFVRIRVRTRNANLIFFHCHYDFHLSIGMAGLLQIGDLKDLPKPPKNFPTCQNYVPKL